MRAAEHLALFLDFDGTLVPLQARPEMVCLPAAVRRLVARLAKNPQITVSIISGRRLRDLRARVKARRVRYAGLHGWERERGASPHRAGQRLLRLARNLLERRLARVPGVWIEDKGMTFGVHYRGAGMDAARRAGKIVQGTLRAFEPALWMLPGKKIWEVLPEEIPGKGGAVKEWLKKLPSGTLPIYIGDDTTDESAFAALPHGLTVRVGAGRRTRARYYLRTPGEVTEFLERLEGESL